MMDFKKPKPKKNSTPKEILKFPSKKEKEIFGVFNGQYVTVQDWDSMNYLYESGSFGKGTLSKGKPSYHMTKDDISEIILQHQFENNIKWSAKTNYFFPQKNTASVRNDLKLSMQSISHFLESSFDYNSNDKQETWKSWKEKHKQKPGKLEHRTEWTSVESISDTPGYVDEVFSSLVNDILQSKQIKQPVNKVLMPKEVIVLNTSFNSHSTDLSLTTTSATLKQLPYTFHENLNLSLEESFFLKSVLQCLNIVDLNFSEIETQDLWEKFNSVDKNFTARYTTYNYYRSKGWVVKSGLKFGGDYLLYKDGPAYYHASYLVKVLDGRKELMWREFIAMNRLVETFNKDLLLCNVTPNQKTVGKDVWSNVFASHSVQEIFVSRWFPSKERLKQENASN